MKIDILGVKVDNINQADALAKIEKWIWNPGKHYIVTPNPEFIVAAQKDKLFNKILNDADLSIPDGAGLKLSGKIKNTFSGTDLMEKLIELAAEKGFTVGFLGGKGEVAEKCVECLQKKYPGLKISFIGSGGEVDENGVILRATPTECRRSREVTLKNINSSYGMFSSRFNRSSNNNIPPTDILFVAFGHIKQEKWIANNLDKIPVKVAMGVGGAFDYLSGMVPRAPKYLRNLGLEWLFRLIMQPWRIKRQFALLQYLWLLVLS